MLFPETPETWLEDPIPPGPTWLIPQFLPNHGYFQITGETDVGKSLLSLEIIHSLVTKAPLWGAFTPEYTLANVAYFLGEHGEVDLKQKWQLLGHQIPSHSVRIIEASLPIVSRGILSYDAIAYYAQKAHGTQFILFDPLAAYLDGPDAENDNLAMRQLTNAFREIGRRVGAQVCGNHHFGKPQYDERTRSYRHREKYAGRGASAIEDATTTGWYMTKETYHNQVAFRLTPNKPKGDYPAFIILKRDDVTLRHTVLKVGLSARQLQVQRLAKLKGGPQLFSIPLLAPVRPRGPQGGHIYS